MSDSWDIVPLEIQINHTILIKKLNYNNRYKSLTLVHSSYDTSAALFYLRKLPKFSRHGFVLTNLCS